MEKLKYKYFFVILIRMTSVELKELVNERRFAKAISWTIKKRRHGYAVGKRKVVVSGEAEISKKTFPNCGVLVRLSFENAQIRDMKIGTLVYTGVASYEDLDGLQDESFNPDEYINNYLIGLGAKVQKINSSLGTEVKGSKMIVKNKYQIS